MTLGCLYKKIVLLFGVWEIKFLKDVTISDNVYVLVAKCVFSII